MVQILEISVKDSQSIVLSHLTQESRGPILIDLLGMGLFLQNSHPLSQISDDLD